uniref:Uncharacterized protein n=1 Tax=Aegilops tauschii subsp. strangulata TaxID=200361 RepID=A0A453T486_AEGTS
RHDAEVRHGEGHRRAAVREARRLRLIDYKPRPCSLNNQSGVVVFVFFSVFPAL